MVVTHLRYFLFALMFLTFQTGCGNILAAYWVARGNESVSSEVKNLGFLYSPKGADCDITILSSSEKLENPHIVIGTMKTHVRRNMNITNAETPKQDLEKEVRKQGCALGGDIVIIDDIVDKTSDTSGHLEAWSSVIKFK